MSEPLGNPPEGQTPEDPQTQPQVPQYPQQSQQPQYYPSAPPPDGGYGYGMPPAAFGPPRNSKLAIASLVLGILSLPLIIVGIGPLVGLVGLVLGIVGIIGAQRKNLKRGLGIAGIVLSAIGLIAGSLLLVAGVHAVNACKGVDKNNSTVYDNCIKHNLKL